MATKKKKKVVKKRKPAAITGAGMKVVKEAAKQAAQAGKKLKYAGKATKTKKDLTILKSLTDPADKEAIKAAKSSQNIKAIKAKADSKELSRGIKASRKDAGKAKAAIKSKNKVIDSKNAARRSSMERSSKQGKLKDKLKASQAARKMDDGTKVPNLVMRKELPSKAKAKVDAPKLKPVTKNNIKKPEVKKPVIKKAVKSTKAKKAMIGAAAVGAGIALTSKKKGKPVSKEAVDNSSRDVVAKKDGDLKSKVSSKKAAIPNGKASPRNENNKKIKPAVKKPEGKAPSTNSIIEKALGNKKIAPKKRAELTDKARKMIAKKKKDGIPWEKILESITMLLSSHILSKGISKRYK